jgi:hypothetical protein
VPWEPFHLAAYARSVQNKPCFVCEIVRGNPDFAQHVIAHDDETIIFPSKYWSLIILAMVRAEGIRCSPAALACSAR